MGVSKCWSNEISLKAGYWRRYNDSLATQSCSLGTFSCKGGMGTGDALCAEGYEGPLCAVCSSGYVLTDRTCFAYNSRSIFSFQHFVALIVLFKAS